MNNLEFSQKLEARTERFTDDTLALCGTISKNIVNSELVKQLVRAAGSVGANYIEANESLSKKDFFYRIRICRKEAKESRYWLKRLALLNPDKENRLSSLVGEASEFILIFSKIITKA